MFGPMPEMPNLQGMAARGMGGSRIPQSLIRRPMGPVQNPQLAPQTPIGRNLAAQQMPANNLYGGPMSQPQLADPTLGSGVRPGARPAMNAVERARMQQGQRPPPDMNDPRNAALAAYGQGR